MPAFCRAAGHRGPGEASCVLVSMLGFCTKCQCFSLICYEGPAFRASPCWLAALWLLQVQANLVALRVLPTLQHGVSVLGSRSGGQLCARFDRVLVLAVRVCRALRLQLFLRMRLRLLYLCLRAWPPCCRSMVGAVVFLDVSGSGRAREVRQRFAGQVTGHQVESFMSACVDARLLH